MPTPITLNLFRGEKQQWWPSPDIRLIYGMTLLDPWKPSTIPELWNKLRTEVNNQIGLKLEAKAAAYAQYLRATGRSFALATAWTSGGAFDSDYNYVITIQNAYLFYWGGKVNVPDIGLQVDDTTNIKQDFIVLNASTIAASSILAFGHKTQTKEITFFHDLPLDLITCCNGKNNGTLRKEIKKWDNLTTDQKIKYRKLKR